MRFFFLFLLMFISSGKLMAQVEVPFKVTTTNKATGKKEGGVSVKLYTGSTGVQTIVTDASGIVNIKIPAGKKYKLEVSKAGKVTRFVTLDLTNIDDEVIQGTSAPKGELEMSLFDQQPNVDYSPVTGNAATEYYFDPSKDANLLYDEVMAERMVKKVDKLLKDTEANKGQADAQYNSAVKEADAFYNQKKYKEALASYEKALAIKPAEPHPNQRLAVIDGILKAEKANGQQAAQAESEYQALITAADNLFNQKKYEEAITRYNEALTKKQEQHPKDQIAKANAEIARLKKEADNAGKYNEAKTAGDNFFGQKSYLAAKDKYREALKFKQDDPYATGKLAEIEAKLGEQKADQDKKKKYDDANTAADLLFDQQKWAEAKAKYNEALAVEPSSTYTQGRIKEIDTKLADLEKDKAKNEQITRLLAEGNTAFASGQWAPSKTKYQEVLKLDPQNATAAGRLTEIEAKISQEKTNAEKLVKIKQLVTEGDALVKQAKLAEAKAKYVEAVGLKPDGALQGKIDSIDAQLLAAGQKAEQKTKYDQALADGEALFAAGKYEESKVRFNEALAADASQPVPKQRIIEADKKIAEALAGARKSEKYTAALSAGNTALAANQLTEARARYQEAIAIDGTKPEAKTKLAEVETLITNDAKAKENASKYQAAIKAAADLQGAKKYTEAKARFQEAAALDPLQTLPKQKITEIDDLIARSEKQKEIDALLKEGNAALDKKDLAAARAKYEQVLTLDSANAQAGAKMQDVARLENELAGESQKQARFKQLKDEAVALMSQANYQEARQKLTETKAIKADAGVDQLIGECDAKIAGLSKSAENEKLYAAALAEGQSLENAKEYDQAIAKYTEALKIKNEQLPKDRIAAINQLKAASAGQAKIDADYAAFMKKGDDSFAAKDYLAAISSYNQALSLKPGEKLPVDKAAEAQRLEQEKGIGEVQAQYQKVLDVAQKALNEKNYKKAKEMYNRALTLKKDDPFPKQKLAETDALIKADKEAADKLAAYTKKVGEAETAATAGNSEGAIALFQQAKTIKSDEVLPDNRIAEIRAKMESANAAAAETERGYQALMSEGNNAASAKDYEIALGKYQEALKMKKNDKSAQDKSAEMRQLLDDKAKSDEKNAGLQQLLARADGEFASRQWMNAKSIYEKVLVLDPGNTYAANQSRLCDSNAQADQVAESEEQYRKVIASADENFAIKDYDKAKDYYNRALTFRASDPYPKKRLAEIDAILNPGAVPASPQPLSALGDPNNSLSDQALVKAETERQRRKTLRYNKRMANANNQDTLISRQNAVITQTNQALAQVGSDTEKSNLKADDNRQGTVQILTDQENKLVENATQLEQYKTAELLNNKAQMNAASQISSDQSGVLDGGYAKNSELLKKSNATLAQGMTQTEEQVNIDHLENKAVFNQVEIKIANIDLDDSEKRLETEKLVRTNAEAVAAVDQENSLHTDQNLTNVKTTIDNVISNREALDDKNAKQAPANHEEIRRIDKSVEDGSVKDYQAHVANSLALRRGLESIDREIAASYDKSDDARQANVELIDSKAASQEEFQRQSYNELMVKSFIADATLRTEKIKLESYTENANTSAGNNAEVLKRIGKDQANQLSTDSEKDEDRNLGTQQALNARTLAVEENAEDGAQKAKANEELLKANREAQATGAQELAKAQDLKAQSANKTLDKATNKPVADPKAGNELGRLYPEGVSQEQFEQKDTGGLLQAVVTRRVVVKNGHGTVYIRTQSLSGLTYSKNGQPSTEYVWQRETQDASLVKNY